MQNILKENIRNLQELADDYDFHSRVEVAISVISKALKLNSPVLVFGNGGSASDALHISGELVGKFNTDRRGLNVICLNANVAVLTAWSNDVNYETVFARQVESHGLTGGIVWGLSTSGNSPSVIKGFEMANKLGMTSIAMTGRGGGKCSSQVNILLDVPSKVTPRIQELHSLVYHYMCAEIEKNLT